MRRIHECMFFPQHRTFRQNLRDRYTWVHLGRSKASQEETAGIARLYRQNAHLGDDTVNDTKRLLGGLNLSHFPYEFRMAKLLNGLALL